MEKLKQLVITIPRRGSEYSWDEHIPFEYSNKEEFEKDAQQHLLNNKWHIPFNTGRFDLDYDDLKIAYTTNNIRTLEEWFLQFS